MSWIHSSKAIALGVLLAVSLVAVGTAAAVIVDGSAPTPTAEGESVTVEATVEEPFRDAPDQWALQGSTELENASWTVQVLSQGDPVDTRDFGGDSFEYDLERDTGATTIEISVEGDAPELTSFNYDDMSAENYTALTVARLSDGNTNELATYEAHRYTATGEDEVSSQEARQAIDEAIEATSRDNDKVGQAISAYNAGNFGNAVDLADEAESGAQTSQLLMIGAGVIVVLALVGGGIYYWRENRNKGHKLQ